jgi:pimeloyl-ACP methyl ester carboxylesterase
MERSAECHTLKVPLNWAAPEDTSIDLFVAVLAARQESGNEPLFILAGGPGQAASDLGLLVRLGFAKVRQTRDIVLLDQRGSGRSAPFDCPVQNDAEAYEPFDLEKTRTHFADCIQKFGHDTSHFQTEDAVRDLDHVRQHLGYDKVSLWGGSYGTRLGLQYLKRFPDKVQAAVLDGVTPPNKPLFKVVPRFAQASLDQLVTDCAKDDECARRFPEFGQISPMDVMAEFLIPTPDGMEYRELPLESNVIAEAMRGVLYNVHRSSILPMALHELQSGRNPSILSALLADVIGTMSEKMSSGLTFSVLCAEDYALTTSEEAEAAAVGSFHQNTFYKPFSAACDLFNTKPIPDDYTSPVTSDIPVLLLSGKIDPITPPELAEEALKTLSRGTHIVAPATGHGVTLTECVPQLIADFLNDPDADVDSTCVADRTRPPFVLSASGPKP